MSSIINVKLIVSQLPFVTSHTLSATLYPKVHTKLLKLALCTFLSCRAPPGSSVKIHTLNEKNACASFFY